MMKSILLNNLSQAQDYLQRPGELASTLDQAVDAIFKAVAQRGDHAIREFSMAFDGINPENIEVSLDERKTAIQKLDPQVKSAMDMAARNLRIFHEAGKTASLAPIQTSEGVWCSQIIRPIPSVGLYIPGGTAPLFSSVLMLGLPAQLAGVPERILCTPPNTTGEIHPAIAYAAELTGIQKIFQIGGIQAIAAMTLGTATVPSVVKICGPGNQYVTKAKAYAQQMGVAIDVPAGPSEVMIWADQEASVNYIAADLLAQAEHGPDSQVFLLVPNQAMADQVNQALKHQLTDLPRADIAQKALHNGAIFIVNDTSLALDIINDYAPEHLMLAQRNPEQWLPFIQNAGSIFLGDLAPESFGDYASGTNHTLPTSGFAKAYGGVCVDTFTKKIQVQSIEPKGLTGLAQTVITMARAEGLEAHARAVNIRLNQ
jgi:histidinol dehydrogenase